MSIISVVYACAMAHALFFIEVLYVLAISSAIVEILEFIKTHNFTTSLTKVFQIRKWDNLYLFQNAYLYQRTVFHNP